MEISESVLKKYEDLTTTYEMFGKPKVFIRLFGKNASGYYSSNLSHVETSFVELTEQLLLGNYRELFDVRNYNVRYYTASEPYYSSISIAMSEIKYMLNLNVEDLLDLDLHPKYLSTSVLLMYDLIKIYRDTYHNNRLARY